MIEVENLTKTYGSFNALKGITFKVEKGEILGFLGPNGAGKTTTMRILTCFFPATSGSARVCGFDVFENPLDVKKRIGYLPENVPLYKDMEITDYLTFVGRIKGIDTGEIKKKVNKVMDDCGITHMAGKLIGELSKGYRQRVGLAQALISDPEVLILDEPTIGLDPKQIIEIRQLIKNLAGRHTVILSTHILPEVSMTCQRVVIINEGRVIAVDTPQNLTSQIQGAAKILFKIEGSSSDVMEELKRARGIKKVEMKDTNNGVSDYIVEFEKGVDERKGIPALIVKKGWGLLEMRPMVMSLEDIFIKLVTEEKGV
ncbi:MAG: ATP-binding cassette domain-containing protein [Nitrospirae bacterium]|nr:ATP-binding cassette domain-containing protein [Nitrospirota bacterium]MBI5180025.1 ATP-binding cassette domain-containing protein [Nitrospirota bacterium]